MNNFTLNTDKIFNEETINRIVEDAMKDVFGDKNKSTFFESYNDRMLKVAITSADHPIPMSVALIVHNVVFFKLMMKHRAKVGRKAYTLKTDKYEVGVTFLNMLVAFVWQEGFLQYYKK